MKRSGTEDERGEGPLRPAAHGGAHPATCGGAALSPGALAVWAVEPYFGGSHRSFLEGLARYSSHEVSLLTMPGRNWKWRMHGAALTLARRAVERYRETGEPPQVFLASDMLDLPVFLAAVAPALGRIPTLLYFHENQLTYPLPPGVERDLGYGFKNLAGALVADSVLFNSEFHRSEFLAAVADLLAAMPDEVPSWAVGEIEARAGVLPVGCDLRRFDGHQVAALADLADGRWGDPAAGPLLLWNQRWEYDKAPDALFRALYELRAAGTPFRLAMAGPNQGTPTAAFLRAREELADRIVQWGRVAGDADYASLLWAADVVVSTAIHEFFGIAVIEAMYCGCRPVLPRRLSYPELVPPEMHAEVLYDEGELVSALGRALAQPRAWSEDWQRAWVARFDWGSLRTRYDEHIRQCWESATRPREPMRPGR
jgi:glycosyltransferase involved in cell wall biosynthesis